MLHFRASELRIVIVMLGGLQIMILNYEDVI